MLDDVFGLVFDVVLKLVATVIPKRLLLLAGLAAVAVGVPLLAGALTLLGAAAVIGVLARWAL